jgi:glycogen operon protein
MNSEIAIGRSFSLGATMVEGGANFSLFSRRATGVELLLFDSEEEPRPARVVPMDSAANRTYHYWHAFVPGLVPGQIYGYRVQGPSDPARGMRFDDSKVLLDPYGREVVVPSNYSRQALAGATPLSLQVGPGASCQRGGAPDFDPRPVQRLQVPWGTLRCGA